MLLRLAFALLCLMLHSQFSHAIDVKELKTKSGATVWLVEDHSVPLINMSIAFAQGSMADPKGQEGAALFLSGLVDEGAGKLDGEDFRAQMEDIGMKVRFDAEHDSFRGEFSTPSEFRNEAAILLRMAFNELSVPDAALERMRQFFILGETTEKQSPGQLANKAALQLILPNHPYTRIEVEGPAAIATLTREQMLATAKRVFSRKALRLVVVGDVTEPEAIAMVDLVFANLPEGTGPAPTLPTVMEPGPLLKIVPFESGQTLLQYGGPGIAAKDPDHLAATLAVSIASSTINDIARQQRGLTYGANFELIGLDQANFVSGSLNTSNENAKAALDAVRHALGLMLFPGPSEEHLESTKVYLKGRNALGFDSNYAVASTLLNLQIHGFSSNYLEKRNELMDRITLDDLRRTIKRLIDPSTLVVVAVGKPEGLEEVLPNK
jgi:zinc protease